MIETAIQRRLHFSDPTRSWKFPGILAQRFHVYDIHAIFCRIEYAVCAASIQAVQSCFLQIFHAAMTLCEISRDHAALKNVYVARKNCGQNTNGTQNK